MRLLLFRLAGIAVPLLVLSQLALPSYMSDRVEARLTEDGGTAEVQLRAFPALRLLAGHGDELYVRARGLRLELSDERPRVFERLGRFDDAVVSISDSRAGPFRVRGLFVDRTGRDRYRVFATLSTSAEALGRYAGRSLGGPLGGALAALTVAALPAGGQEIPAHVRATIDAAGGEARAVDARADVGGLPAGPLAILITDALLAQL